MVGAEIVGFGFTVMTAAAVLVLSFTDIAVMVTCIDEDTVLGAVKVTVVPVAPLKVPQEETEHEREKVTPALVESLVTAAVTDIACP